MTVQIEGETPGITLTGESGDVVVTVVTGAGGGGGFDGEHNDLLGRSAANAHPTSAIAGLDTALAGKVGTGDPRLTDARTPTAHASSHAAAGSDPITPAAIGAATSTQGALADTAVQPDDLATVATTGDYADLTGAPTIPDISGLQPTSQKNQPGGYAGLDETGAVPAARIGTGIARTSDVSDAVTAHNTSELAHPDIRALIESGGGAGGSITASQVAYGDEDDTVTSSGFFRWINSVRRLVIGDGPEEPRATVTIAAEDYFIDYTMLEHLATNVDPNGNWTLGGWTWTPWYGLQFETGDPLAYTPDSPLEEGKTYSVELLVGWDGEPPAAIKVDLGAQSLWFHPSEPNPQIIEADGSPGIAIEVDGPTIGGTWLRGLEISEVNVSSPLVIVSDGDTVLEIDQEGRFVTEIEGLEGATFREDLRFYGADLRGADTAGNNTWRLNADGSFRDSESNWGEPGQVLTPSTSEGPLVWSDPDIAAHAASHMAGGSDSLEMGYQVVAAEFAMSGAYVMGPTERTVFVIGATSVQLPDAEICDGQMVQVYCPLSGVTVLPFDGQSIFGQPSFTIDPPANPQQPNVVQFIAADASGLGVGWTWGALARAGSAYDVPPWPDAADGAVLSKRSGELAWADDVVVDGDLGTAAAEDVEAFDPAGSASTAQAAAVQRANHTGTQAQSTVTNLVSDLAGKATSAQGALADTAVQPARTITAGTGLTGGGSLAADRTLAVSYGTTSGTAAQGNDTRITGAVQGGGEVLAIDVLTQAAYDALTPKVATTLYLVVG